MTKITYKVNGVELAASFEDMRDLTLFVAANMIKDEDLVSIDLGQGEIGGGIIGLANYTVDKIKKEKEEEARIAAEEAEREAANTFNMVDMVELGFEDKYLFVTDKEPIGDGLVKISFDNGDYINVGEDDRFYIVKDGIDYHNDPAELDCAYYTTIRVRAKYIGAGDIIINK